MKNKCTTFRNCRPYTAKSLGTWKMFDNPTDNHTDILVPLYYKLPLREAKKSPDRNHNLISSECGQDTAAHHISGHSLHAFSRKCPETSNLTRFTKSKYCQNYKSQQTVTQNLSVLKVVKIHQHAKFQAIPSMRSPGNAWKPKIWPVSLSQNTAKITKVNRPWP